MLIWAVKIWDPVGKLILERLFQLKTNFKGNECKVDEDTILAPIVVEHTTTTPNTRITQELHKNHTTMYNKTMDTHLHESSREVTTSSSSHSPCHHHISKDRKRVRIEKGKSKKRHNRKGERDERTEREKERERERERERKDQGASA